MDDMLEILDELLSRLWGSAHHVVHYLMCSYLTCMFTISQHQMDTTVIGLKLYTHANVAYSGSQAVHGRLHVCSTSKFYVFEERFGNFGLK